MEKSLHLFIITYFNNLSIIIMLKFALKKQKKQMYPPH